MPAASSNKPITKAFPAKFMMKKSGTRWRAMGFAEGRESPTIILAGKLIS